MISPSQGLYLHRTTQHRKTRTNIHALSGIRTHDPSNQPVETHASDRTATAIGNMAYWYPNYKKIELHNNKCLLPGINQVHIIS
jgi:hypothetical protein